MLFASTDQLEFKRTTRRDDLISLTYLMLFLLNNCEFPCLPPEFYKSKKNEQIFEKFGNIVEIKIRESRDRYAFVEFDTYEAAEDAF